MRTRLVLVLCFLAIAAGLAVWAGRAAGDLDLELPALDKTRMRPQGGFFVGVTSEPPKHTNLNPLTSSDAVVRGLMLRHTHDTLLDRDLDTAQLVPGVALAIDRDATDGTLTVRLRDDVRFADGAELSVDDLEFVFRAAKTPGAAFGSVSEAFDDLTSFERLDARSFRLRVAPGADAREAVGSIYPVLQARYWRGEVAALAAADGKPLPTEGTSEFVTLLARVRLPGPGTGAFALARDRRTNQVAWRRGIDLTMVQNPSSWRRRAQPDRWNLLGIRLRFISDPGAILSELRAGRLDWYNGDDADRVLAADPALQQRMRLLEYRSARLGHHMVMWNLRRKPYDDARVRRALSMLFDRQAIVSDLLGGHGRAAAAWYRPQDPEYPADLPPMPFDPANARALLTEAGLLADGAAPFTVRIVVANQSALQRRMLEMATPAFAVAGVHLAIELRDWSEVVVRYEERDFDGLLLNWSHTYAGTDVFASFHSSQADPPGKNYSGLRDSAVDALIEGAARAPDDGERIALLRQLAHMLRGLEPVSLLVHPRQLMLIDRRFMDAEPCALGVVVDRFWVPP